MSRNAQFEGRLATCFDFVSRICRRFILQFDLDVLQLIAVQFLVSGAIGIC